ncbi:MAG: ATP-binding cassette domain-containing protein [Oscillospiraceae bacterium]
MDIVVSELSKSFDGVQVLERVNAVFPAGRTTCVMGRSGCGKTTLLNILMGLIRPDSGAVTGIPHRLSAVFQEDRLCESFSVLVNAGFACPRELPSREIEAQLHAVGLDGCVRQRVSELSGGMKRRVAIVRAVLAAGELLLLDEPFRGLDEQTCALTAAYLREHTQHTTVIMVTHSEEEVAQMGGRLLIMGQKGAMIDEN